MYTTHHTFDVLVGGGFLFVQSDNHEVEAHEGPQNTILNRFESQTN